MKDNNELFKLDYFLNIINEDLLPSSVIYNLHALKSIIKEKLNIYNRKGKEKLSIQDKRNFFVFIIKSLSPYFEEYKIVPPFPLKIISRIAKHVPKGYKSEEDYLNETLVYGNLSKYTVCSTSSILILSYIKNKPTKLSLNVNDYKYYNMEYIPLCKGCCYYGREEYINTQEDFEEGYIKDECEIGQKVMFHWCNIGKYKSYGHEHMDECVRKESEEYKKIYNEHLEKWNKDRKSFLKRTQPYRVLALRMLKKFDEFVYNYIDKDTFLAVLYLINRDRTSYQDRLTKEMERLTLAQLAKYYIDFDNNFIKKWI